MALYAKTPVTNYPTYHFVLSGEKPLPLLKQHMEGLKAHNVNNPVLKAKDFELVAIPPGAKTNIFIADFIQNTAVPNKVYIAITKMGAAVLKTQEVIEMTGKCKVNDNVVKGARKWVTKHVVYKPYHVQDANGNNLYDSVNKPIMRNTEIAAFDTKGEAMDHAKQYAMDHDCDVIVELEKRLEGSSHRVADISPMKRKVKKQVLKSTNEFVFFGRGE